MGEGTKEVARRATLCVTGDGVSGDEGGVVVTLPGRQYEKRESSKQ